MPADLAYGALIDALGDEVEAIAKDLEVYAGPAPPSDYALQHEIEGVLRTARDAGFERFHPPTTRAWPSARGRPFPTSRWTSSASATTSIRPTGSSPIAPRERCAPTGREPRVERSRFEPLAPERSSVERPPGLRS
jgi:hypothetical protein